MSKPFELVRTDGEEEVPPLSPPQPLLPPLPSSKPFELVRTDGEEEVPPLPPPQPLLPPPPSLSSVEALVLLAALPILDYNRLLYIYSCLPLHFLEQGWPLWQLSALLCGSAVARNPVAWAVEKRGDGLCVPLLGLAAVASTWMAKEPNSKAAVLVAIALGQAVKCQQPLRGMCARVYSRWPAHHEGALRIMTVTDVAGYSSAAFWGGVLYERWESQTTPSIAPLFLCLVRVVIIPLHDHCQFAILWN
jgi:hypothetical protein